MAVKDLLKHAEMSDSDYVKIIPGDLDEVLQHYDVVE
jgi:hypothetical protein